MLADHTTQQNLIFGSKAQPSVRISSFFGTQGTHKELYCFIQHSSFVPDSQNKNYLLNLKNNWLTIWQNSIKLSKKRGFENSFFVPFITWNSLLCGRSLTFIHYCHHLKSKAASNAPIFHNSGIQP
jgi:hypothetical protein